MIKPIMMKRCLALVGTILLLGAILFEEKHRAGTITHHPVSTELPAPAADELALAPDSLFLDNIHISLAPQATPYETRPNASLAFQKDLPLASLERLEPRVDYKTEPVIVVQDKEVTYALFGKGGFSLTLNLKPAYLNPEAIIPTHIDTGLGVSIKF